MLDPKLVKEPGTDEWWITRLCALLGQEYPTMKLLEDWKNGTPPITTVNQNDEFYAAKVAAREQARIHLAGQIVDSQLDRLKPQTFKTAASDDDNGDAEANRIWKRNRMGKKIRLILDDVLTYGRGYAMVETSTVAGEDVAKIHAESPWWTYAVMDPQDPDRVLVAIKFYRNELDTGDVIVLFRFDESGSPYQRALRLEGTTRLPAKTATDFRLSGDWNWDAPESLETTDLPIVAFTNVHGVGLFAEHLGALARINEGVYKREFISASQAWKQRWINKPEIKEESESDKTFYDAENGEDDNGITPDDFELTDKEENALFAAVVDSNPGTVSIFPYGTEIKETGATDFRQLLEATKEDIKYLGESTNTMFTMAISEATNMSTSGADGVRERADSAAQVRIDFLTPALELLMSLCFQVEGDEERSDISEIEVVWKPVREISLKEKADSYKTLIEGGLSRRTAMKVALQLTPTQVVDEEQNKLNEAFMEGVQPEVTTTTTEETTDAAETDQSVGGSASAAA